jgi:hypothetical protein
MHGIRVHVGECTFNRMQAAFLWSPSCVANQARDYLVVLSYFRKLDRLLFRDFSVQKRA